MYCYNSAQNVLWSALVYMVLNESEQMESTDDEVAIVVKTSPCLCNRPVYVRPPCHVSANTPYSEDLETKTLTYNCFVADPGRAAVLDHRLL